MLHIVYFSVSKKTEMVFVLYALFPELQPKRCLAQHMPGPLGTIECSGAVDLILIEHSVARKGTEAICWSGRAALSLESTVTCISDSAITSIKQQPPTT